MNTRSPSLNVSIVTMRRRGDDHLSFEQLAEAAGLSAVALGRLVHLGLIEPDVPGAAIIVDLLERVERLEAKLVGHAGR